MHNIQLVYNVVFISAILQNDSVTHIFFLYSFPLFYPKILNRVPCVIQ